MKLAEFVALATVVISLASVGSQEAEKVKDLDELEKAQEMMMGSKLKNNGVAELERHPSHHHYHHRYRYLSILRYFQRYVNWHICNPVTNRMMSIARHYITSSYKKRLYYGVRNMVNSYICGPLNRKLASAFYIG